MNDTDHTLTSPLHAVAQRAGPVLALTVVWHPDPARVGEQFFHAGARGVLEVGRYTPLFGGAGKDALPLGYGGVARSPLRIACTADTVSVQAPDSRMALEVQGVEIADRIELDSSQLAAGIMLGLGRAVLLCLHWADSLPNVLPVPGLIGVGSAASRLRALVRSVAASDVPVLLLGETGTGKEVAARAIHAMGARCQGPMVAVNMATLNESLAAADLFGAEKGAYTGAQAARRGWFAEAEGGTLFLDEIGNTPAAVQPMLLRVLENGLYRPLGGTADKRSNARLVAATDQDLYSGNFNQPLLRRLESFVIALPPLRTRREDIGVLIQHILQQEAAGADTDACPAAPVLPFALVSALANYHWPGNVRQLGHTVRRAALALRLGQPFNLLDLAHGPASVSASAAPAQASVPSGMPPREPARARAVPDGDAVLAALDRHGWQIQPAAQALGISRPSLYKYIAAHPDIRRAEHVSAEEIAVALAASGNDLAACAARLRTPAQALQRRLQALGLA